MIRKLLRWTGGIIAGILLVIIVLVMTWYHADIPVNALEGTYFTPESSYIQVGDSKVHVRQRGSGPTLFLIHGSFASLHTWDGWESELMKSYKTISMDLPGHGLTGPNASKTYSTDDYEKLVIALADILHVDTFYVAGNSMGGNVAWKIALRHPQRAKKLILVDATGFGRFTTDSATSKKQSVPFIFKMLQSKTFSKLLTGITPRFLVKMNMEQVYGDPTRITSADVDRFYDLLLREGNRQATLERLRKPGQDCSDSIPFIQVPTLILWGEKDRWIPVEHAFRFAKAIQSSQLKVFPQAGHVPMEEIPSESAQEVFNFLNQ
jgi:pimeloyl-ACP methyl ester carboxylesterase